jgi:phasin family protein
MKPRQNEHEADEVTRKAADQMVRTARQMSEAAESTVRQSAETAQRSSDQVQSSWRSSTSAANQFAERSLEKWSKMFGMTGETATQAFQQSSGNVQAMLDTTTVIAEGLRDLSGEWVQFVQARTKQNLDHVERLMGCRNLQDLVASQTQIVRDSFEAFLEGARRTSERSTKLADEAIRKMSETPLAPR